MKKFIVFLLCGAIIVAGALYLNRGTIEIYSEQKQILQDSDARMKNAEAERARLLIEKARLESPAGKEELARKLGYKQAGEVPVRVR